MAVYKVRGYFATGFNAVNIPDKPSLLDTDAFISRDFDAIDIMQDMDLSTILVKSHWGSIKNIDYLKLYTDDTISFYFVTSVNMQATDVAQLSVVQDFWNTAGGIDHVTVLDGITSRVHITNDNLIYPEADPLTAPAQRMGLWCEWILPFGTGGDVYVESTVDLVQQAANTQSTVYYTGTDAEGKYENPVTVPSVKGVLKSDETKFTPGQFLTGVEPQSNNTRIYNLSNETQVEYTDYTAGESAMQGITACRALGIENCIMRQVQIPKGAVGVNTASFGVTTNRGAFTDEHITRMTGVTLNNTPNLPFKYYSVKNNRALYGDYTPYGLITAAGNRCELNAEDLISYTDAQQTWDTAPHIRTATDPHLDGKPYFSFFKGSIYAPNSAGEVIVLADSVEGLPWKEVPLTYSAKSGNLLNTIEFRNRRISADTAYANANRTFDTSRLINENTQARSNLNAGYSAIPSILQGIATQSPVGVAGATANMLFAEQNAYNAYTVSNLANVTGRANTTAAYLSAKAAETSQYMVSTQVSQPEIRFPYQTEPLRDGYGNGVLVYHYQYTYEDISRIDKLLTMYGYKYTKALSNSDFSNRKHFNYIECSNVSVKGKDKNIPMRVRDGVAMMLRTGVRIWHERPNVEAYNDNPVA